MFRYNGMVSFRFPDTWANETLITQGKYILIDWWYFLFLQNLLTSQPRSGMEMTMTRISPGRISVNAAKNEENDAGEGYYLANEIVGMLHFFIQLLHFMQISFIDVTLFRVQSTLSAHRATFYWESNRWPAIDWANDNFVYRHKYTSPYFNMLRGLSGFMALSHCLKQYHFFINEFLWHSPY